MKSIKWRIEEWERFYGGARGKWVHSDKIVYKTRAGAEKEYARLSVCSDSLFRIVKMVNGKVVETPEDFGATHMKPEKVMEESEKETARANVLESWDKENDLFFKARDSADESIQLYYEVLKQYKEVESAWKAAVNKWIEMKAVRDSLWEHKRQAEAMALAAKKEYEKNVKWREAETRKYEKAVRDEAEKIVRDAGGKKKFKDVE